MKIYVLANTLLFKDVVSGGDVLFPQIVKHFKKDNKIIVITTYPGKNLWKGFQTKAEYFLLPQKIFGKNESLFLGPLKYLINTWQGLFLINRLLSKEKEKFIIYSSSDFFPDTLPAFWARIKFKNSRWFARVYHIIEVPWKRKGNFFYNLFSYFSQKIGLFLIKNKADLISPLGGTYKDLVTFGYLKDSLFISNAGVDRSLIREINTLKTEKKYKAIHVGTLTLTKGVYDLLEIWSLVIKSDNKAKLAIIGGGSKKLVEDYKKRIREMGLSKNIDYFGFVPSYKKVFTLVKSSCLYLCPGHEDGWSLPVAEAMSLGIPVIAYNLKMFGTAFKQGYQLVPLYNQKLFAEKIVRILKNDVEREKLASDALIESEKFNWYNIANEMLDKFKELINQQ